MDRPDRAARSRDLITQKAYRYISPSFYYAGAGKVITRLKGAGLVHNPNLQLEALAAQEDDMNPDTAIVEQLAALVETAPGRNRRRCAGRGEKPAPAGRTLAPTGPGRDDRYTRPGPLRAG